MDAGQNNEENNQWDMENGTEISKTVQESTGSINWHGHENSMCVQRVIDVSEKRRKGRPKRRWMDNVEQDIFGREGTVG